jgi:sugar phosphate permease
VPLVYFPKVAPIFNTSINVGTMIATLTAVILPLDKSSEIVLAQNTTLRIIFGFPIVLYSIMALGFVFFIKTDTPKFYLINGNRLMAA